MMHFTDGDEREVLEDNMVSSLIARRTDAAAATEAATDWTTYKEAMFEEAPEGFARALRMSVVEIIKQVKYKYENGF